MAFSYLLEYMNDDAGDIGCRGAAQVDDKVCVHGRHLGVADPVALKAARIDEAGRLKV